MSNQNFDKAIVKYQIAVDKNISESEVLWNRFNAILVFNSILIAAIGLTYQDNILLPHLINIFLPIIGITSCVIWFFVTYRGFRSIYQWIECAREIEDKHLKEDTLILNPILYGNEKRGKRKFRKLFNTENASYLIIILTLGMYILFLIFTSDANSFNKTLVSTKEKLKSKVNFTNEKTFINSYQWMSLV